MQYLSATTAVEVQLITQIGAIVVAIVTTIGLIAVAILNRTRQHTKALRLDTRAVRHQVENDHPTNFRDELDDRHGEILAKVDALGEGLAGLGKSVGGIRDDLRQVREELQGERDDRLQLRDELMKERERIKALEDTQPHQKKESE